MSRADVVILGAGASGLATAGALRHLGIIPLVLERDDEIGGTWRRRYERLHLHTVRALSGLPHFPIPATEPRYVRASSYADYLRRYAEAMGIEVQLGVTVNKVERSEAGSGDDAGETRGDASRGWRVRTDTGVIDAHNVIVAMGRHCVPRMPQWRGAENYRGILLHGHGYRTGREFAKMDALVVGIGNTGAEIAADLVECGAKSVSIAVRTAPPITSREIAGIPVQYLGVALAPLPPRFVDWLGRGLRRIGTGDLNAFGIAAEQWGPFQSRRPPVIDVGFLKHLKRGMIAVRPDVSHLTPGGAAFADGTALDADVIIVATGYTTNLGGIIDEPVVLDSRGFPMSENPLRGLYFVGYNESPRGQLFESSRAARRLARRIAPEIRASRQRSA